MNISIILSIITKDNKELAHKFGVSTKTISRWLNGYNQPPKNKRKYILIYIQNIIEELTRLKNVQKVDKK